MSYETVAAFCGREVVLQYGEGTDMRKVFAEEMQHHANGNKTILCSFIKDDGKKQYRSFEPAGITFIS